MDKFFPYVQFGGCVAFFLLSAMLIFSRTFESKHKLIYIRARLLLILSQLILCLHFLIQFNTGWRLHEPTKAIMCNMILFPLAGMLMLFSLLFMFTKGNINYKISFWCIWTYVCISAILIYGYINPNILFPVECLGSVTYTILFTGVGIYVHQEFKSIRARMDNYFSEDTASPTTGLSRSIVCMLIILICVPFAILSNSGFLKIITLMNFAIIFYYVNRFIYYGYDIQKMIDRYFEIIEADTIPEDPETANVHSKSALEEILGNWIQSKAFTKPEITIEDLVKQTGLRRSSLTQYLNGTLGLSFRSWLNSLRIEEAKTIMTEHPDYSHETIADLSGFSSRTYFLKVFKDKEGMPPGDWMISSRK